MKLCIFLDLSGSLCVQKVELGTNVNASFNIYVEALVHIIVYPYCSHFFSMVLQVNWFVFRSMIKSIIKPMCCNAKLTAHGGDSFVSAMIRDVLPSVVHRLETKWQQVKQQLANNTRG